MLQNATPLRKSTPWPPNISDEHVSCTAAAAENASLQILFKCPKPAIVFGNDTRPSPFADFWPGAQSLALATKNNIWTSKSAPNPSVFYTIDLETCFAPQRHALFRHLNFQKCSEPVSLLHFWLGNVLRATTACTFSTFQLPKVLRTRQSFTLLTWKCASRHNGVPVFISHLASWLRTRRFSEPTFRPSGAANHWKNTVFRDFPTFSHTWIFFLRRLSLFDLLSSSLLYSDSSHLCFSGSLTSKLPSIISFSVFAGWLDVDQLLRRMYPKKRLNRSFLHFEHNQKEVWLVSCISISSLQHHQRYKRSPCPSGCEDLPS